METTYITSALKPEQLPDFVESEIAFIGRSNSGKSSLLNSLASRRSLAREGRTPGVTQMINFFSINNKVILADLPGYGFRAVTKQRSVHWDQLIECYLARPNLLNVFFLLDCRRELNDDDLFVLNALRRRPGLVVILTKCDKISKAALRPAIEKLKIQLQRHRIPVEEILAVSTLNKLGVDDLRKAYIDPLCGLNARD